MEGGTIFEEALFWEVNFENVQNERGWDLKTKDWSSIACSFVYIY